MSECQPAHVGKYANLQETIAQIGLREKCELSAVKTAITHKNQAAAGQFLSSLRNDFQRSATHGPKACQNVGQRTEYFLQWPLDQLNGARIQPCARKLGEVAPLNCS